MNASSAPWPSTPSLTTLSISVAHAHHHRGRRATAGVLVEQSPRVIEAYSEYFDQLEVDADEQGMWACVHGVRKG